MTVFELARAAGISPASVRLYRRSGMLPPPHELPTGGRGYDEQDAALLRAIIGLRRLGVSAERIVPAAGSRDPAESIVKIRRAVEQQRRSVARARTRLDELDACLNAVAAWLAGQRGDAPRGDAVEARLAAVEEP